MNFQHKDSAAGRWGQMPFVEQMANIGSEVERALNWRAKNNPEYSRMAFERALELIDLTLACLKSYPRLKEVARVREGIVDYFTGGNIFKYDEKSLKQYFLNFAFAARRNR